MIYNAEVGRYGGGANASLFDFVSYPSVVSPLSTGDFILKNIGGTVGEYNLELNLDTNIGEINQYHKATGNPTTIFSSHNLDTPPPTDNSRAAWPQNGVIHENVPAGSFQDDRAQELIFEYTSSYISGSHHRTKPMHVELTYASGHTGTYRTVAGIDINWNNERSLPGSGYKSNPEIIFEAGSGNDIQAKAVALSSGYHIGNYQRVHNVYITHKGSGYKYAPDVIFAEGQPSDTTPIGTALVSGYTEGNAGTHPLAYAVTGVEIINSGLYWDYTPSTVYFTGQFHDDGGLSGLGTGDAYGLAQYEASGVTGYTVTGISITESGAYYSGSFNEDRWGSNLDPAQGGQWYPDWSLSSWIQPAPSVHFSGEHYDLTGVLTGAASGTGMYEVYTKGIENWDLYTGIQTLGNNHGDHFNSVDGYKYNNWISGDITYSTENEVFLSPGNSRVYIVVGHELQKDNDPMSLILNISGYGDTTDLIEGIWPKRYQTAYITGYKTTE